MIKSLELDPFITGHSQSNFCQISFMVILVAILTACAPSSLNGDTPNLNRVQITQTSKTPDGQFTPTANKKSIPAATQTGIPLGAQGSVASFTYHNADGNRNLIGSGDLPYQEPIDIQLPGTPVWILATPHKGGIVWSAALEDGRTYSYFMLDDGSIEGEPMQVDLPAGMPPGAISDGDIFSIIQVQDRDQSPLTHPVYLPLSHQRAYITKTGQISFMNASDQVVGTLDVRALPDARILRDENDRLLVLSDPTDRYAHAVLGDPIEAGGITLIETIPEPRIVNHITLPNKEVIEGIAPIWTDFTGNGQREIIVTVSDLELGAGIVVFTESGDKLAQGPKIGTPYRWRHQIAITNFDPAGHLELAVVRTPHIGGSVEFYQFNNGELSITAEYPGITSHTIGSRNLDLAAAGDFDGDGLIELLVLTPDLSEFVAVRRTKTGAEEVWRLPLDGFISSNLAGASLPGVSIAIGAGRADNVLRIWLPQE